MSDPRLAATLAAINIVEFEGRFYRVPQRLGTMCLEDARDRNHPEVRQFTTLEAAIFSVSLIDYLRVPGFRLRVLLKDAKEAITGKKRPTKQCASWGEP